MEHEVVSANENPKSNPTGNAVKDPSDWVTKDEAMTGAQASYLKTLSEEAGVEFDSDLSKGEASLRIDELRKATGKGEEATPKKEEAPPEIPDVPGF